MTTECQTDLQGDVFSEVHVQARVGVAVLQKVSEFDEVSQAMLKRVALLESLRG